MHNVVYLVTSLENDIDCMGMLQWSAAPDLVDMLVGMHKLATQCLSTSKLYL